MTTATMTPATTATDPVIAADAIDWQSFQIPGSHGYEFKFDLIGREYTGAYSIDLVRIAPGGASPTHLDRDNHAFYIIEGAGEITIAEKIWPLLPGSVAKIPVGVLHSVRNTGAAPLLFLTIYDPPRER
jgi:mannose-6-phosphate isomerase-like protein (cupin superfamily)